MLNPAIGKLINTYENRYDLVIDVAKRARMISKRAQEQEIILTEKAGHPRHGGAGRGKVR